MSRKIVDRVKENTSPAVNAQIARMTECNIRYYAAHPEEIETRLAELDEEWDIERALETHAAGVSIVSVLLGMLGLRKFLFVPAILGGFLLLHVTQGWTPPLPLLRRMNVRSTNEIETERYALRALRGDFSGLEGEGDSKSRMRRILELVKS